MSDSLRPHGLYSPWNSPGQDTGVGKPFLSPEDLPNPGIEPRSPPLQADSLPAELPGKSINPCYEVYFARPLTCLLCALGISNKDCVAQSVFPFFAAAKSLQLCTTLCDPIDGSPPRSPVPGTLQARTLEWVAISFSNA